MEMQFESQTFSKRVKSMLKLDFRRMFTTPLFYIMAGIALVCPILILVMTSMMEGTVSTNPTTGAETVMEGFKNTWQAIASSSDASAGASMDLTSMCNSMLVYFMVAVLVCLFVSSDFSSGYSKNLFAVRAKKNDYVISKTVVCFVSGAVLMLAWVFGSVIGGAIAGLSFDTGSAGASGVVMCIIARVMIVAMFVSVFITMSTIGKQKTWLSMILSFAIGMIFVMSVPPMIAPLNTGVLNLILAIVGSALFSVGMGAVSNAILRKTSLV